MFLFMSSKGLGFVKSHLASTILFAILYYLSDQLLFYKPILSASLRLGSIKKTETLLYYFHYSLITQSTLGYSVGKGKSKFQQVGSNIFKILNLIQIISIFIISGYYF